VEDLVQILDTDIDTDQLWQEIADLIDRFPLHDQNQISLTSVGGNNDWDCSTGRLSDLPNPERFYSTVNRALEGTLVEEYIKRHKKFYRWRLLRLQPRRTYSVHTDNLTPNTVNMRLHIPVVTNPQCYMCFFEDAIQSGVTQPVRFEHLALGNSYITNTTGLHTAVNYGLEDRYHIVGVRYEKNTQ
jgi:hypothetical protein